jgi:pimeloyl-ACP methyl ester carboxylesterase
MIEHFAAPDGRRLAYRDSGGDGAPILCLAGLTRNGRDFDALAAHLAPRYRVIRLDARGRGESERAEVPEQEYTVPVETGDALALLGHLGLGSAAVIGTSRGGITGMSMAAGAPGSVAALVLNDIGAEVGVRGLRRILSGLGRAPEDADFDAAAERLFAENRGHFPSVPFERWQRHARAIHDDDGTGRPCLAYDPELRVTGAGLDESAATVDLWPLFDAVGQVPVLVIRGENSDILSRATVAAMAARHPGLALSEVPGRGHAPFLDEPEAVRAIDRFLGEVYP